MERSKVYHFKRIQYILLALELLTSTDLNLPEPFDAAF